MIPLHEELNKLENDLKHKFFCKLRPLTTIKSSVLGSNTARSYRRDDTYKIHKPSSLVKNWLHTDFLADPKNLRALKEAAYFGPLHKAAFKSLKSYWERHEPDVKFMQFYHFAKIIDLFFKSIARWDELSQERRDWYLQNAHVPIDKWSLTVLKLSHPKYTKIKGLSMSHIGDDEAYYHEIQNVYD